MKKKITVLFVLLTFVVAYAAPVAFHNAKESMPVYIKESLKRESEKAMQIKGSLSQTNAEIGLKDLRENGITLPRKDRLRYHIAKETTVEKTKIGDKIKEIGGDVRVNATYVSARSVYKSALSAKLNHDLLKEKVKVEKLKLAAQKAKLSQGQITNLEYRISELELKANENKLKQALYGLEEVQAQLSRLMGKEILLVPETLYDTTLDTLENYIQSSQSRFEIQSSSLNNKIIALDFPYYEEGTYLDDEDVKKEYDSKKREYKINELKHQQAGLSIESEIKAALDDIEISLKSVEVKRKQLDVFKGRYANIEKLYQQGKVTLIQLKELGLGVKQAEIAHHLAVHDYNTKRIKLIFAVTAGPAYK